MAVNVSNMPINTIYRFDTNRYVMATMLSETRGGNYPLDKPVKFHEIYQFSLDGALERIASGTLINNSNVYDFDHDFAIRDYDNDMVISFRVPIRLEKVSLDELYELRRGIELNNKKNKK